MKKIIVCLMLGIFLISIYGCSLNLERVSKNLTDYKIEITLNEDYSLNANMQVCYYNNSETALSSIY